MNDNNQVFPFLPPSFSTFPTFPFLIAGEVKIKKKFFAMQPAFFWLLSRIIFNEIRKFPRVCGERPLNTLFENPVKFFFPPDHKRIAREARRHFHPFS